MLRAIITTVKEIGAKSAFTDGDVQSAKYVICMPAVFACVNISCCTLCAF